MSAEVFFHMDFYDGEHRDVKFSDYPLLTPVEAASLYSFVLSVQDGEMLIGRNKPSWENAYGDLIKNRVGYKQNSLWHYHAGPYSISLGSENGVRNKNIDGKTSGPIIHYKWLDPSYKKKLMIIAFSPEHLNFPKPREKPNHLDDRGGFAKSELIISSKDIYNI